MKINRFNKNSFNTNMSQSGRSMVEMLGTLAIIGVLSIGGIAGYSYGMDKYRANETINDIMLKMVDLMSTANQNGVPDSTSWSAENPIGYPVSFVTDIPSDRYGIQLQNVPSRVCKMVGDALKNMAIVYVGGEEHNANEQDPCDSSDKNTMEFYFDTLKCEPACKSDEICLWGECVSNQVEATPWRGGDRNCSKDDDCGPCGTCGSGSMCYAKFNGYSCMTDTNVEGLCRYGVCVPKSGCNETIPCNGKNEYCASPNTSNAEPFPNNSTGACVTADFKPLTIDVETEYWISNSSLSFWDAQAACKALGFDGLIKGDMLRSVYNQIAEIQGHLYIWTAEGVVAHSSGWSSYYSPTESMHAICW